MNMNAVKEMYNKDEKVTVTKPALTIVKTEKGRNQRRNQIHQRISQ